MFMFRFIHSFIVILYTYMCVTSRVVETAGIFFGRMDRLEQAL